KLPGIYHLAGKQYRRIADNRERVRCSTECAPSSPLSITSWYKTIFEPGDELRLHHNIKKITKVCVLIILLQLNSTIHYGLIYRFGIDTHQNPLLHTLSQASNSLIMLSQTFIGVTPHALYVHDHFTGYDHLIAITYREDRDGIDQWLPFVSPEGRILAPNWGRVHSMWANIAVTPNIDEIRLKKFIMKVTSFWGHKLGLDLEHTRFDIKLKKNEAPSQWMYDLRNKNLHTSWIDIGSAHWHDGQIYVDLPIDIDAL
ncbi:MAG: DCC1-like thiol-disulfide oxidoreductase family protein, partial [Gammaproteobacteria bacterium]